MLSGGSGEGGRARGLGGVCGAGDGGWGRQEGRPEAAAGPPLAV